MEWLKWQCQYASYVLRHKWYVFRAAWKLGIPWRGLVHDWSKFLPSEWFPYARYFYGRKLDKDSKGYMHQPGVDEAFDLAWLLHQHRNPHHWQFWMLTQDSDPYKILPMPEAVVREMVADWTGAGLAQGKPDILAWYEANKNKMKLHPDTRKRVEELLRS